MNELCHIWKSYMNELHMNALYKWVMSHINASSPHMNKLCYIWMRCNARVCHDKSVRVIHDSCIYTYAANSGATFCGILHVCAMTRVHLCDMTHVYICMQESVVQLSVVVYVAITWLSNHMTHLHVRDTTDVYIRISETATQLSGWHVYTFICTRIYESVASHTYSLSYTYASVAWHTYSLYVFVIRIRWYPYAGNSCATVCGVLHVCTMCGTSDGYVYIFVCR